VGARTGRMCTVGDSQMGHTLGRASEGGKPRTCLGQSCKPILASHGKVCAYTRKTIIMWPWKTFVSLHLLVERFVKSYLTFLRLCSFVSTLAIIVSALRCYVKELNVCESTFVPSNCSMMIHRILPFLLHIY